MKLSSDFLKKNQHFLRSCILYEVVREEPIYYAYNNFCYAVGKDAMEYPDFEFWYYRFYQGELDLDYDRSADPEPKKLVDMPVVLMKEIVKNLDAVERTCLRSMNHAIKDVADSFDPVFEKLDVGVYDFSLTWKLNKLSFSCDKQESGGCRFYKEHSHSWISEKSEESYIQKSLEYLTPLLTMPNIKVNHFSLRLSEETIAMNFNCDDLLPVPLNAKSVFIESQTTNQVVQFLSGMRPGSLESISLKIPERENYERIFETDQFKQAKNVEFDMDMEFNMADLVHFSHLKTFKFNLIGRNTFEDVPKIRDIISTSENFESCEMIYYAFRDDFSFEKFAASLGAEIPIGPLAEGERLTFTHRYQIPESNECLEFIVKKQYHGRCLVNVFKTRIS
ncbi:hypothetical protein B9Z55_021338 [Caenorhabditis nigoni]|uniref:F-box domain-containing protein n=1 Tax=Caenorhabditis nigoni TaxID=1611254 RepID=A0A2G5TS63_9PELO|nr:hypothetical protein B9Z55_021338 [Caenorhabditis nigoni]